MSTSDHNYKVLMCRCLYYRIWIIHDNLWGITSDNYFVHLSEMIYLKDNLEPRERLICAEILARLENKFTKKLLPLSEIEKTLLRNHCTLSSLDINNLNKKDYDRLAQDYDMSEISRGLGRC